MSSKASLRLQSSLLATWLVQPVSDVSKGGHLEILSRQIPGKEKEWIQLVDKLLTVGEGLVNLGVDLHVCRRYVRRNGAMAFGWHISLDCKNAKTLEAAVDTIISEVLHNPRPAPAPLEPAVVPARVRVAPLAPGKHPQQQLPPPRPPGEPGTVVGTPPPDFVPSLRVIQNTRDGNGKVTIVEEMQLPHVYAEMNIPNAKGMGAKLTGGG